jgi:hypothetical protein
MIVTPTTDVVLDVLEAAEPVTQRAAAAKLDALKSSDVDFATAMETKASEAAASAAADQASPGAAQAAPGSPDVALPTRVIKAPSSGDTYRKFEAFVLQTFVETMLPKNADLFGKGTAGDVWRSMLAEQLGNQLAKGKGIGLAKTLAAAHPAPARGAPDKAG